MYTVFTSRNPASLYKAVKSVVLINKPCYCLARIHNLQHCSLSNSFSAVCIVGAKNPYAAIFGESSVLNAGIFFPFVKVYKQLFLLRLDILAIVHSCCVPVDPPMCSSQFIPLCRHVQAEANLLHEDFEDCSDLCFTFPSKCNSIKLIL